MCRVHLHKRIQKPHAFRRNLLKATHAAIFCPLMGVAEARTGRSLGVAEAIFCDLCDMWVNGVGQWKEHKMGKKHKKHLKRLRLERKAGTSSDKSLKGIEIPKSTVVLIEQAQLLDDAVGVFLLDMYRRSAIRARL